MKRALLVFIFGGCLISCSLTSGTGRTEKRTQANITRVSDDMVVLRAELHPVRDLMVIARSERYVERRHGNIRMDGTVPQRVLSGLDVFVSGKKVELPPGTFNQLGDPHLDFIEVGQSRGVFFLQLSGGDGGGSWAFRFVFVNDQFVRVQGRDPSSRAFDPPDGKLG